MRKLFVIAVSLLVLIGLIWAGNFYWQNLRGIGPALTKPPAVVTDNNLNKILTLPPGFVISIFAKNLGKPRVLSSDPSGNLLVSIPDSGKVVALPDRNGDGVADSVVTVVDGLNKPHGLAWKCDAGCQLYITETDQVAVYDYDLTSLRAVNKQKLVDLPGGGNHFTRTLLFLPAPNNKKLLVSVGSSCNVCDEQNWRRAKILVYDTEMRELNVFASGLRNAVFLTIHPVTGKIWATEMGRDYLGDDRPPDEINIVEEGKDYGWPLCYGQNIHDTDYDASVYKQDPCAGKQPSYRDIPAHSAPLGLAFIPEEGWPEDWWHNLLVAYHGSWNRTEPTGYKLVRFKLDKQGNPPAGGLVAEDFLTGWLTKDGALGRPVDILTQPGGVIYISDDKAGVIYKVTYQGTGNQTNKDDLIQVTAPAPNQIISSPLTVTGQARGYWFFEASFPIRLLDDAGRELAVGIAQAQGEWMTEEFVPFQAKLEFTAPLAKTGTLVLAKDNPSGLPAQADELRLPVSFAPVNNTPCVVTGCSRQVCSDQEVITTCEFKPEYVCYSKAVCARQDDGQCAWTATNDLQVCLQEFK